MSGINPIRLGIIGCGRVAWERHHPALRCVPGIEVAAVCDRNPEAAARIAGLFSNPRRFERYQDLLALPELDAVAVLTPTASHAEIGMAALEAGKHLFLEKPVALSLEQADCLAAASRRSDRKTLLCFNLRWHRLVRAAREVVQSGRLGRIKAIRSVYTHNRDGRNAPDWHRKLDLGGGVSFNEAVHHFDLWRHLLGLEILEVFSRHSSSPAYEDETSVVSAQMEQGVMASAVFSFLSGPNSEIEIFGTEGRLLVSLYRFDGMEFYSAQTFPGNLAWRARQGVESLRALPGMARDLRSGGAIQASFAETWRHFAGCVRGTAQPGCLPEDGRAALAAALAAVESCRGGRTVPLAPACHG